MKRKSAHQRYISDRIWLAKTQQRTWILIALSKSLVLLAEIVRYWSR